MENKKWIRFAESFILLPVLTISAAPIGNNIGPISQAVINIVNTPSVVSFKKLNIDSVRGNLAEVLRTRDLVASETSNGMEAEKIKAETIDDYFNAHDMPLAGMGMKMILEAKKNDLDWRLLPAIAVRESTGGQNACTKVKFNSFGWGSCKIGFKSNEEAIEIISLNLGGNNPKTAYHYYGKTTKEILRKYNPPSIVLRYAQQVISIMNDIGTEDIAPTVIATT